MSKINFIVSSYSLNTDGEYQVVTIDGLKMAPPSKRITLYQPAIKVISAKIIYKHKKGDIEYEVSRVNRLKSFGELRLHTSTIMHPGEYEIAISYIGDLDEEKLKSNSP